MVHVRSCLALALALVVIASFPAVLVPQESRNNSAPNTQILERNVRAELGFLASDAMQGRGSGTNFERLAAEYIASMFQQFGLEAGGDSGPTGAPGFVQHVVLESRRFASPPVLTAGAGDGAKSWQYGRDFLVTGTLAQRISGKLQVIKDDEPPSRDAFVLMRIPPTAEMQARRTKLLAARSAGSAAVIQPETEANKRQREGGARLPALPARFAGEPETANAFAMISARPEVFEELASLPNGTPIELGGDLQSDSVASTWNAVGILRGSDPRLSAEAILLSAHLDHVGVSETSTGDKIFNGADDNASGSVAVIELARVLAAGRRPKRTIVFVCFGSEERGGHGARYFIQRSPFPLDKIAANLNFEMLGRPDSKVPANTLWLTGYERSNLGPELAKQGARLVADPHPDQNFFQRSDNYTLALRGVVAHTVSSFGLHSDYHRPSDEVSKIDFPFMTQSINSMVAPISWLANSDFRPAWLPGQQPTRN